MARAYGRGQRPSVLTVRLKPDVRKRRQFRRIVRPSRRVTRPPVEVVVAASAARPRTVAAKRLVRLAARANGENTQPIRRRESLLAARQKPRVEPRLTLQRRPHPPYPNAVGLLRYPRGSLQKSDGSRIRESVGLWTLLHKLSQNGQPL